MSEWLDWTYNSHTVHDVRGDARAEEQDVARYRPLPADERTAVAPAPRVTAANLTDVKPFVSCDSSPPQDSLRTTGTHQTHRRLRLEEGRRVGDLTRWRRLSRA